MKKPNYSDISLLEKVATELGYEVTRVFSNKNTHTLRISSGNKFYIASTGNYSYYPTNQCWHTALFKNKIQTKKILADIGYLSVKSYNYTTKDHTLDGIMDDLNESGLSFPVIIKPSQGMRGRGIVYINNLESLTKEATSLFTEGTDFCVQPIVQETEYRVLYIDGRVHLVHSKSFNSVTGDGIKSVSDLTAAKTDSTTDHAFLAQELSTSKLSKDSILEKNQVLKTHITKTTHGNLVNEIYFRDAVPESVSVWTAKLADALSVTVMGLDIFASDINDETTYRIIEINSNPAFSYLANKFNGYEELKEMWSEILANYFSR